MPRGGLRELEGYHLLYKDSGRHLDNAHFTLFGLQSTPVKLLSAGIVCKSLYPCSSLLCFQEFPDAILEWQHSPQRWLRLARLILVPG